VAQVAKDNSVAVMVLSVSSSSLLTFAEVFFLNAADSNLMAWPVASLAKQERMNSFCRVVFGSCLQRRSSTHRKAAF
jgi:hypothetical protein